MTDDNEFNITNNTNSKDVLRSLTNLNVQDNDYNQYSNNDYDRNRYNDDNNYSYHTPNPYEDRGFRSVGLDRNFRSGHNDYFSGGQTNFFGNSPVDPFAPVMPNSWGGKNKYEFNSGRDNNNTFDEFKSKEIISNNTSNINELTVNKSPNTDIKKELDTDKVPVYDGIVGNSIETNCYVSKEAASVIKKSVTEILETMLNDNEVKLDFQQHEGNYEFSGRVFTSLVSDFYIKIYKLKEKDNKGNISIVEIRNIFGDEFGYYEFERIVLEKLHNAKIINKDQDKHLFGNQIVTIDSLTLESDDEDDDQDDNKNDVFDILDEDITSDVNENDKEFDFNLCEIILETLYNKDSFREEYMHDAYQLATYLEKNDETSKNMVDYIIKNESEKLIQNIMEPIKTNRLFCAFIILYVLESINILLAKKDIKSKLNIPENFKDDIESIQKTWSNPDGIQNNLGPITVKFTRSQQIEKRCKSILKLL